MDILDFVKNINIPVLVLDKNENVTYTNPCFNIFFGENIFLKGIKKFKNSFSIQSCTLYPENIIDYNPINLAIEADGNFNTIAVYQKSSEDFFTLKISSFKYLDYFVIEFADCSDEYKLEEVTQNYYQVKSELEQLKIESSKNLETKDKAQTQAIKMALLNRIFEALRKSIDIDKTLNFAFKEMSEIFGFSKLGFAFSEDDDKKFEIKNIYPSKYKEELSKITEIDEKSLKLLKSNKFVISNVVETVENKNTVSKPQCRILIPIYHTNKLLGIVIGIFPNKNLNKMSEDMINAVSAQLTGAIVQAYLFHELNTKNEQLQSAYTKLEQTQLQLVNSEKMASLGQLVAGVAHEINTPLASINSNNSIFEKILSIEDFDKDIIDTAKSMIETDKEAIKRISNIVKSLKRYVRLDEAPLQEADINKELDLTLELLKHETKNRIEIVKNYCDTVEIKCYPNLLNQVFMNLLMNAVHSIENEGKIFITTSVDNESYKISIKDTGCGMDEKTQEKIFKTGFTTKKVGIGTGLGLMISKDIIEKHSGTITFNSQKGVGTEFIITIPIKDKGEK